MAGIDSYSQTLGPPEARNQAAVWKLSVGSSVLSIVSGPNPTANLVDLLALSTITRTVLEEDWVKTDQGRAFQPWFKASRTLETNAWRLADGVLTLKQQQEMRDSIDQWWQSNAGTRRTFFARPQEFTTLLRRTGEAADKTGSVFTFVGLDPTSGLDPAVREVTRTRLFAERAMYIAQRMPFVIQYQIELLRAQLLEGPQVAAALTNITSLAESADRLSRASESVSQTAAQLPDRVTAERKAILDALEAQEGRLRELSAEVGRTLTAGEKMSTSLNATLLTFDTLSKRFGADKPNAGTAPGPKAPPNQEAASCPSAPPREARHLLEEYSAMVKDIFDHLRNFLAWVAVFAMGVCARAHRHKDFLSALSDYSCWDRITDHRLPMTDDGRLFSGGW